MPSSPAPDGQLTRRTALALALAAAASACTPSGSPGTASTPTPSPTTTAAPPVDPPVDPDVALALEAITSSAAAAWGLTAVSRHHDDLAGVLRPAIATHLEHQRILERAAPGDSDYAPTLGRVRVPRDRARALDFARSVEDDAAEALRRQAFSARSGPFARLLASMSAASAQQSERLRTERRAP